MRPTLLSATLVMAVLIFERKQPRLIILICLADMLPTFGSMILIDGDDGDNDSDGGLNTCRSHQSLSQLIQSFDKTLGLPSEESLDEKTFSKSEETFVVIEEPGKPQESLAEINGNESSD
ncbi:hypothetical protein BGX20_003106 [Mortierella sp. AD010]|nr:hypothetical protein BGX20_003106 [Mortierella sp. AD010]